MSTDTREMVGVFLTWTTYGTWLPGDARGWRAKLGGNKLRLDKAKRGSLSEDRKRLLRENVG